MISCHLFFFYFSLYMKITNRCLYWRSNPHYSYHPCSQTRRWQCQPVGILRNWDERENGGKYRNVKWKPLPKCSGCRAEFTLSSSCEDNTWLLSSLGTCLLKVPRIKEKMADDLAFVCTFFSLSQGFRQGQKATAPLFSSTSMPFFVCFCLFPTCCSFFFSEMFPLIFCIFLLTIMVYCLSTCFPPLWRTFFLKMKSSLVFCCHCEEEKGNNWIH